MDVRAPQKQQAWIMFGLACVCLVGAVVISLMGGFNSAPSVPAAAAADTPEFVPSQTYTTPIPESPAPTPAQAAAAPVLPPPSPMVVLPPMSWVWNPVWHEPYWGRTRRWSRLPDERRHGGDHWDSHGMQEWHRPPIPPIHPVMPYVPPVLPVIPRIRLPAPLPWPTPVLPIHRARYYDNGTSTRINFVSKS